MNYERQLNKVCDFIGKHLDEKLTLSQLSAIACFSKYHFHRLFTAYVGLSLQQYIRWLRLKRAAHQLIVNKDKSIILDFMKNPHCRIPAAQTAGPIH